MTKQVRDCKEDMELAHKARYEYNLDYLNKVLDALFHWLSQAAELASEHTYAKKEAIKWNDLAIAEKERADKAEKRLERHINLLEKWNDQLTEYEARIRDAEAREKKLREAIEDTIDAFRLDGSNYRADTLEQLLASLYPEEGTK